MKNLTSDYTAHQLENYRTSILEEAKRACAEKMHFYQDEINNGYSSGSNIEMLKFYHAEYLKWVPVVRAAKERDAKEAQRFASFF